MAGFGRKAMAAVMAGLVGVMPMAGVVTTVVTPSVAFAVTYGTGSITINQTSNTGATYDGYRIFKGVVTTSNGVDSATDIVWESDAVKTAVLDYLDSSNTGATKTYAAWLTENEHTGTGAHDLAQNAAEYIGAMINGSATAAGTNTTPKTTDAASFANKLTKELLAAGISPTVSAQATGVAYTGTQGYYLFVTTDSTIGENEAGTAPIWTAVSSTAKTLTEKSAIPTIDKKVKEDSGSPAVAESYTNITAEEWTEFAGLSNEGKAARGYYVSNGNGEYKLWEADDLVTSASDLYKRTPGTPGTDWGIAADANRTQDVQFELTGTVAQDVKAFSNYYYQFTDTMTGLTMSNADVDAAVVTVDGETVTQGVNKTFTNGVFTVTFDDLFATYPNLSSTSVVKVLYNAHLDENSVIGGNGNPNVVNLTYSSNPNVVSSHDKTPDKTTRVFTYQLNLTKVDQDTRETLSGAGFTIQVADTNSDEGSRGKYVQADGSLGTTAYTFTTNSNGQISVPRIDEGTYVIHETTPAANHEAWASDVTLTVSRTFDANGLLNGLTATVTGGNGLFVSTPNANQDGVGAFTAASGTIPLTASDKKIVTLPGTGLSTSTVGMIVGLTCVVGGMALVVSRKRKTSDTPAE